MTDPDEEIGGGVPDDEESERIERDDFWTDSYVPDWGDMERKRGR
jgi:hypothetical protein